MFPSHQRPPRRPGGKQISDAENQALDEVSAALGTPPAA
jgi:hypothetical protein